MNRREALKRTGILGGSSLLLCTQLFTACTSNPYIPRFFLPEDMELLDEIGETILPESEGSPGAKSAYVANFVDTYVADCYKPQDHEVVRTGIEQFKQMCLTRFKDSFTELDPDTRHAILVELDAEAKTHQENRRAGEPPHYFTLLKHLILFGYFTSKEGATQTLRYVPIPGRYDGNIPLKPKDKSWAL